MGKKDAAKAKDAAKVVDTPENLQESTTDKSKSALIPLIGVIKGFVNAKPRKSGPLALSARKKRAYTALIGALQSPKRLWTYSPEKEGYQDPSGTYTVKPADGFAVVVSGGKIPGGMNEIELGSGAIGRVENEIELDLTRA